MENGFSTSGSSKKTDGASKAGTGIGSFLKDAALLGACAGVGALAGAANYHYEQALKARGSRRKEDGDPPEKEYEEGARWMESHPLRQDAYLRSDEGLWLHGNFIPAESSRQYVICVHGYLDRAGTMGLYARVYHDRYGMNVLLPDLRGHGLSDGDYIGMGYYDSADILRWIDWILKKDPAAQIILHGISMGAATVLLTTGRCLPRQVVAAVSDSAYTSAMDIFKYVYQSNIKGEKGEPFARALAPVLLSAVRAVAIVRAGYDLEQASPVRAVARSKTPTLFIHGQADTFVPPSMMPPLYRAAACPKAFLWIPGAEHVQSVVLDPEAYWAKVEKFLHARGLAL